MIDSIQLTRVANQTPASGANWMANRENERLNEASASCALAVGHGLV